MGMVKMDNEKEYYIVYSTESGNMITSEPIENAISKDDALQKFITKGSIRDMKIFEYDKNDPELINCNANYERPKDMQDYVDYIKSKLID